MRSTPHICLWRQGMKGLQHSELEREVCFKFPLSVGMDDGSWNECSLKCGGRVWVVSDPHTVKSM